MKKLSIQFLAAVGLMAGLFAFQSAKDGAIQGTVVPAEGASVVMAISGRDTVRAEINTGAFMLSKVKPGTYTVWFKGIAPYKDTSVEAVAVVEGSTTDVGAVKLLQ
ncbi:carboxypeptidase-like regulatory domain-containing protein [Pedobacter duraquae]|uniref:Carboxypeptidase family protein n=1 Tax=Pedobacter duraquae TaxID=425511 RepID=A0A4R6IHK2_9SPHI|nr:carboxypeptidase-like regulatory domain-containing protein [Pedobacter duraquae]TDO21397.1 hypothetical protein CLV32_2502 [Pedobacter duraquae]